MPRLLLLVAASCSARRDAGSQGARRCALAGARGFGHHLLAGVGGEVKGGSVMLGKKIGGVITTYSKVVATRAVPCRAGCSLADPFGQRPVFSLWAGVPCARRRSA